MTDATNGRLDLIQIGLQSAAGHLSELADEHEASNPELSAALHRLAERVAEAGAELAKVQAHRRATLA